MSEQIDQSAELEKQHERERQQQIRDDIARTPEHVQNYFLGLGEQRGAAALEQGPPMATIDLGNGLIATERFARLSAALSRAQGGFEKLRASHTADIQGREGKRGYQYSYAKLGDVLAAAMPSLTEQGIAVVQFPAIDKTREVTVTTVLSYKDEYIKGSMTITADSADPRSIGKASTYARRYSLLAMIGLSPEDDDAAPTRRGSGTSAPAPNSDEIDAEKAAIRKLLEEAASQSDLKAALDRINRLPTDDKMTMNEPYLEALKRVKKGGSK